MHKIRSYHATLAVVTLLAYFTGDFGFIHDWLGYVVGVIIIARLIWAVFNPRQLGLNKFYPVFDGISWANGLTHPAVSKTLILATLTGLMTLGEGGEAFDDLHEGVSGIVIWAVVLHGGYLYLVKRPLARFMLYRDNPGKKGS